MKTERFEQEKLEFESEKTKIEMKINVEDDKFGYQKQSKCDEIKHLTIKPSDDIDNYEKFVAGKSENDLKSQELDQREDEIEEAYKELQNQMDNFNKELEERELVLEEKEICLAKTEKELVWKSENLKKIEASLVESKIQAEELRTSAIPGLESQSENMEILIKELEKKKKDLETVLIKLNKEIETVIEYKNRLSSTKGQNSNSLDGSDTLEQITMDLETKMIAILEREKELDSAQERLENEKAQIIQTAEFLKKAHLDVEQMKVSNEKEIFEEKNKLKAQFLKLEAGMNLISTKEAEVLSYRKILEEKDKMLRIKEDDFNKKNKDY